MGTPAVRQVDYHISNGIITLLDADTGRILDKFTVEEIVEKLNNDIFTDI